MRSLQKYEFDWVKSETLCQRLWQRYGGIEPKTPSVPKEGDSCPFCKAQLLPARDVVIAELTESYDSLSV